ncbi:MAG: YciI family protein [Archangium sp.]
MKFVALISGDEGERAKWPGAQQQQELSDYFAFDELLKRERALVFGEALTSNGAKGEQLLGLYLLEVKSREQALELAAKCPGATTGSIEVREVVPT